MLRNLIFVIAIAGLTAIPAKSARAGDAEAAAAIILGGLLGAAIINNNKKRQEAAAAQAAQQAQQAQTQAKSTARRPRISAEQRQQNREVQEALNYFGYNAGVVDGLIGRNSRGAMRRFETAMGFPADGSLNAAERAFLLESQQRALATSNQPPYNDILAAEGRDGLLKRYRDEKLGVTSPDTRQAAQPPVTPPRQPTKNATNPSLPDFNVAERTRSASQLCNEINILTMANGGMATSGTVTDAEFALNEQFCLARAHAESESNGIASTIADMSEAQITAQCEGQAAFMAPVIPLLTSKSPAEARAEIGEFVDASGKTKGQLITGGRVCLGVGYRVDNPEVALASAAVLIASGLPAYGEIIAHHTREGLGGLKSSPSKGKVWLEDTLSGLENGDVRVLGQTPDRIAVLTEALTGKSAKVASSKTSPGASVSN